VELLAVLTLLAVTLRSVFLWRMFLSLIGATTIWWGLNQLFAFGADWLNWAPYVVGIMGAVFWHWRAPPSNEWPRETQALTARSAFFGALLCWVLSLALCYAIAQGTSNELAVPGAVFFALFGLVCMWRGAQVQRAAPSAQKGENAL
jgi:hypothetical protein